ncbi:MAG TPA: metallophosphoesterase [Pyrinomonadaceae bacterium]|nr:metallophosphoesterase [Pyrinomonadaceae bacterium]
MITLATITAIILFLGLLFLLFRAVRQLFAAPRKSWRARLNVAFALILLIVLSCVIWGTLIEPNRLVVKQRSIQIETWPKELSGLRIALIGDVHTGAPFIDDQKLRRIVELTNQQNPDLIVLLGDYMVRDSWHGHEVAPEVTAAGLKDLRAPLGAYAVIGNHDWWYNGERVWQAFDQAGIRVLESEVTEIKTREGSFWLAGLADLWTRPLKVTETIAQAPAGATIVAITHNPDIFKRVPTTVPLMLAAHTHGGQVNFPLWGTPIVPSRFGRSYTSGHIFENGHHMFVTTGIGTSILPVRFRVTPEIVILTVTSGR